MLTVHPSLPAKTLKELIALDKARPKDLNYGSGGTGTGPQMSMELLKLKTGMRITHIPYKGTGPMLIDHIAGHVQVSLSNMIATLPVVESKRLRALVVSGAKRSKKVPELPTLTESGIEGFEDVSGHMIMVPSATPKDIIARLHRELVKALQAPEVMARLDNEGAEIIGNTPEQAGAIIRADLDKWADVIKRSGIKPD
jgi:tripartite-type tricarboxylate transporter receptor subunit TctC